jgi:hypothetical protein
MLGFLALTACSGSSDGSRKFDAGVVSDIPAAADAIAKPDVAPMGEDAATDAAPAADAAARSDAMAGADLAGQADVLPADDSVAGNDAAPGTDATVKSDTGADAAPRRDAAAGGDAMAAETSADGKVAPADGSARPDAAKADGQNPLADTLAPDPGNALYIAVDGSDGNPGTKELPLATIPKAASLAQAGTLIYMRGGTYKLSATVSVTSPAGTAEAPIRLWAYPGEAVALDFAAAASISKGLSIDASYWHVKGLVVEHSAGRGIQVSTGTGIVIESCETRYNGDMGLVVSNGAANALILNCDSHHNFDDANAGENADGFGAKSNVGTGVVFRGCRAWANADDGWDLYGAPSAVRFEDCWAYKNGDNFKNVSDFAGDGNGFKLGKSDGELAHHVLVGCLAWGNLGGNGYEDNNNTGGLTFYGSVAYQNKGAGFEAVNNTNHIAKNNLSFANGKADNILAGSVTSNNSWNGFTVTEADFLSLDDAVAVGPRQADGSLPATDFLHLAPTSGLIDKGVDVGLPFLGAAPDLGAYEAR